MESLGYFIPSLYLPLFARHLGLSAGIGTLLIALINASGVVATVTFGMLCDRFHVTNVVLLSTLGATVSIFLFWGFSNALPLLVVFSIFYGFFAGGFISANAGVIKLVKQGDMSADVGIMLAIISAARGVGAIASGPLSEIMLKRTDSSEVAGGYGSGYGSSYGPLIVFTGVTAAAGGVSWFGRRLGWV